MSKEWWDAGPIISDELSGSYRGRHGSIPAEYKFVPRNGKGWGLEMMTGGKKFPIQEHVKSLV